MHRLRHPLQSSIRKLIFCGKICAPPPPRYHMSLKILLWAFNEHSPQPVAIIKYVPLMNIRRQGDNAPGRFYSLNAFDVCSVDSTICLCIDEACSKQTFRTRMKLNKSGLGHPTPGEGTAFELILGFWYRYRPPACPF